MIAHQLPTNNPFGKIQCDIDLKADEIIKDHLKKCGAVHSASSEEIPEVIFTLKCVKSVELCPEGKYYVTFDPIDGSAVMDSNFSVASAFSIWNAKTCDGLCGKDLVGAALSVYGSRTTLILYNT